MKIGQIVLSTSGRDSGCWLVVVGKSENRVLVADGDRRKLSAPKAKNPMHLVPTEKYLTMSEITGNKRLRKMLFDKTIAVKMGESSEQCPNKM